MEKLVTITINSKTVTVPANYTIMQAADSVGIDIPRLCFLKDINENASCRVCVVEIVGMRSLKNSCSVEVGSILNREGTATILTNSKRVRTAVRQTLELIAANHRFDCWKCPREHNCELLALMRRFSINNEMAESGQFAKKLPIINESDAIVFDSSKCVLCGRCIGACEKLSGTGVLNFNQRGFVTCVGSALNHDIADAGCIYCGKCIQACPTGAIREKEQIDFVEEELTNHENYLVATFAPAVRAAIGEEFGNPIGTNCEGKLYASLHELGFDDVTDVNFGADLTIMEEGTEFIGRLTKALNGEKVALPMITSCSPGWIRYIEQYYPQYLENLSSCKSPQQMQGSMIKHYYAKQLNVDSAKIKVVSIMPCIAKKYEANRPEMENDGLRDIDYVLTTREYARLVKRQGIDFNALEDYTPTSPLAQYTGAGVIFGATGGVMEAALRTVTHILDPENEDKLDFTAVRGVDNGIKEATLTIAGHEINVAVVHGAVNIPELFKRIESGKQYHFVEVMACTGGCINGGGQPIVNAKVQECTDVRALRASVLYQIDQNAPLHKSHENAEIIRAYKEFLGEPNSHLAHKLLHTTYGAKKAFSKENK